MRDFSIMVISGSISKGFFEYSTNFWTALFFLFVALVFGIRWNDKNYGRR